VELLREREARQSEQAKLEQLQHMLLKEGLISQIRPKATEEDVRRFNEWKPVPIKGKPLSETIIEDRERS